MMLSASSVILDAIGFSTASKSLVLSQPTWIQRYDQTENESSEQS
jgi:hypothetical protein